MTNYLSQKIKLISFFSIVMVVVLHSYNIDIKQNGVALALPKDFNWFLQTFFSFGITRIAVPIFFIISGFLFFKDAQNEYPRFKQKILKRFKTLVIPYFFWVLFGVLFYYLMQSIPQSQAFFTKKLIKNYSSTDWFNVIFVDIIPYQLWFLRDLIVMVFLSPIIYFLVKRLNYFYLLILSIFWFCNQDNLFFTSEAILFFSFGAFIAIKKPALISQSIKKPVLFLIFWIAILIFKTILEYYVHKSSIQVSVALKISILIGIYAFWGFYDILKDIKMQRINFLLPILNYSFFIYVFHEPTLTIIKKVLFKITGTSQISYLLIYAISPIITIILCYLVGATIKKIASKFYVFITGSR